ncbi:peptide ABC transporter substrate-binding protein [Candidatus Neptunochlamydia vexilliferae]|uniref:Oligopeptide-binding protein OppA n=1 Tax=Candidatus Neptunichlamydia vexilliferae TaxID=1651774 RepID=A0ABS0B1S7_9BACT|nr:peptide ABC transporter substrate-binding protein [Candidatus Neptunochlamydia vexilliferae]MBF5059661.1 Oligopeptide-binding protein OppA [Candidatus Neptunochlamydia vexilliferae]
MRKLSLLLLLIPIFFACQKKEGRKNKTVHISILAPVRSLDPRISTEKPSKHIMNMLYEGLMRLGPNGEVIPAIAKSVTISEDQTVYTFHLRDSIWSNGDPVTAYDFEYAWKKSVTPEYAQPGAFTFYTIKNVAACLEKRVGVEEVGVQALDEKTLKVELEHPAPYFLHLCTCTSYSPIHKEIDLKHPNWSNSVSEHLVTNGPFSLTGWKKSVELCLQKNPNYWDANGVQIEGVEIQVVEDATTQFLLFEKGKLDWIGQPFNNLPNDIIVNCYENNRLELSDSSEVFWFFLNTEKPLFNNKNFRKALAYAINRDEIASHIFQLGERPAMGILNGVLSLQEAPYFEDGNVKLAKEHLEKALEEMEMTADEIPKIVLSQRSCIFTSRVNQAIQEQLRAVLGLKVEIDQVDWPLHFSRVSKGNYEFGEMPWHSWLKDPIYMLDTFRSKSVATNMSRWEHPHYQEILTLSDNEIDPEKRKEYLREAEAFLMEELPVIPLCFMKQHYLKNPKLQGVYVSPLKEIDFRYAFFQE